MRSSSTSISTAYRRGCVVRSSPRPCYFCATSCPCSKKLSRSSTRDRTALFIEHIVSKMTASALLLVGAHGTLLSCSTTLSKRTAPQSHALRVCPPLLFCASGQVFCRRTSDPRTHTRPRSPDDALKSQTEHRPTRYETLPRWPLDLCCALLFSKPHSGAVCLLITKPNTTPVLPWPPTRPLNRVSAVGCCGTADITQGIRILRQHRSKHRWLAMAERRARALRRGGAGRLCDAAHLGPRRRRSSAAMTV